MAGETTRIKTPENWETDLKEIKILEAVKLATWLEIRKLDPVLAGQKQVNSLNLEQMQGLIENPTTAILSFYTTSKDTYIFILRHGDTFQENYLQLHTCKGQGWKELQQWILNNWIIPYVENSNKWRNNMETILQELSKRLQLNELIAKYLTDIEELIIVPHLSLHQIPFAALPLSDFSPVTNPQLTNPKGDENFDSTRTIGGEPKSFPAQSSISPETLPYLNQRFRLRILPSLQILNYCQQRPSLNLQEMGLVEDATSDLYFTTYECENIAQLCQVAPEKQLKGYQATTNNYKNLVQQINQLHSSHHAKSNPNNPLQSQLLLADGSFTLGQILTPGWRMPNLLDVFLSCCETNFTNPTVTDDILTIATGFLCAGARSVVSTQWAVDDLATALFSIFYYEERQKCTSRSQALQRAQERLSTLTGEELDTKYKAQIDKHLQQRLNQATTDEEKKRIEKARNRLQIKSQQNLPFAHPVYWAGFISQGLD